MRPIGRHAPSARLLRGVAIAAAAWVAGATLSGWTLSAQRAPDAVLSQLTWFDRAGVVRGRLGPVADHGNVEISPDGSRIAVAVLDPATRTRDIWVYSVADNARSRFTTDTAEENWMLWSPRGDRAVLNSLVRGRSRLLQSPASALMPTTAFETDGGGVWPVSWSPDGRTVLFVTNSPDTSNDIWALPIGGGEPRPFQHSPASENWAAFSPDGRWVAFSSTAASSIPDVFVTRFPEGGRAWRVSADGGSQARWRRDGKEILYLAPDRRLMAATVDVRDASVTTTRIEPLFELAFPYGSYHAFDVSPDGTRFLVNTVLGGGRPSQEVRLRTPTTPSAEGRF